jgi:lantibiotic transport system permease protein
MIPLIQSEWMKYRRTLTPWLIVGGPFILAMAQSIFNMIAPLSATWEHTWMNVFNWWAVIGIPFGVTLLVVESVSYERRSGAWKVLRAYSVSPEKLYWAKYIVLSVQTFIASVLFVLFVSVLNFLEVSGAFPWKEVISGFIIAWLTALAQISIMLWIANRFSYGITVCIGLIGLISGVVMAAMSFWMVNPWGWPTRALVPILGFHPNGMILEQDSPFWDLSVIPIAILLSVVGAVIFLAIGAYSFKRQEVK